MGRHVYKKPEPVTIQGTCVKCLTRPQKSNGGGKYKALCRKCTAAMYGKTSYRSLKLDNCELCGFEPEHPCQLDVDHIDGDHSNNDPANLQTLCANCHRLKTQKNLDWVNKGS